jgi:hypothetical protein
MQGSKNWILPKEMNANWFFWDSHGWKSNQTPYVPLWDRMTGVWLNGLRPGYMSCQAQRLGMLVNGYNGPAAAVG